MNHRQSAAKKHDAQYIVSFNPATGEEVGRTARTDLSLMGDIFAKARSAQREWAGCSYRERRKRMLKMRSYIADHAEELAHTVSLDTGKTRIDALATEVIPCAIAVDWYTKNAACVLRPVKPRRSSIIFINKRNLIVRQPFGVVGIISPWNYPLSIPFGEVVMALAAGNAVLLKTASATVETGKAIARIAGAAALPEGLFTHLAGNAGAIADAMFGNRVDKLFFTGSVATGKQLMEKAARTLTPVSLELGGKDPMIVMPDADLERASNGAAWAGYQNAGQSCGGVERVYVHASVYDEFVKLLAEKTMKLRFGEGSGFALDVGSMTTKEQWETVDRQVNEAVSGGARIIACSAQGALKKGAFYPPTLIEGAGPATALMRDETFGPVIPVVKFSTLDEAVAMANDSTMGLTASIWTGNPAAGREIAMRLEAGVTTINDHLYTHGMPEAPWLGWKESGIGATHSALGLLEMTRPKLINWDLFPTGRNVWWYPQNRETYEGLLHTLRFICARTPAEFVINSFRTLSFLVKKMFTPWR